MLRALRRDHTVGADSEYAGEVGGATAGGVVSQHVCQSCRFKRLFLRYLSKNRLSIYKNAALSIVYGLQFTLSTLVSILLVYIDTT